MLKNMARSTSPHVSESLSKNAAIFREIDEPDEDTDIGLRLARIKELDYLTANPFLMALRAHSEDSEFALVLEIVESFLVRRLICGLSTRGYGTLFIDMMNAIVDQRGTSPPRDRAIAFLLRSDAEASRWPNDAEFGKAWTEEPLYERLARPRLRFVLRALEEHMRTSSGLTESFTVPARLEIEHVMPQSGETNWPLPLGEPLNGKAAQTRRNEIHTIGNLTLLTKKLNGTLSNAAWSADVDDVPSKQKTIKAYSLMMLSKDIVDRPRWDEDQIRKRRLALFAQACQIWPAPPAVMN